MFAPLTAKPAAGPQPLPPTGHSPVIVTGSAACEALATDLSYRFALLQHTGVALESQQLDEAAKQAALDEVKETVAEYDKEHPATGPLHVYILDGKAAAATDDEGMATIKALVTDAMTNPERTVAALMPEDETVDSIEKLHPATLLANLAKSVLATESVTTLVGKEALESFLIQHHFDTEHLSVATEGFGDAVKAFRRVFSSKAAHPDGLPKSANLDVSAVVRGRFAKTYLNPSWVDIQKLHEGPIDGRGIAPLLMVNGKVPSDPASAVRQGAGAVRNYVTGHAAAMQKYLTQVVELIHANANAADGPAKVAAATKLETLPSPFKASDAKALEKLPGNPTIKETDGNTQVHPATDGDQAVTLPALNAAQIRTFAKTALEVMSDAYALSREVASHLQVFNRLVYLSHDKALVAKLSPTVAKRLAELAKGQHVWILFDYCTMLLMNATGLERWCYRTITGKSSLESYS